MLEVLGVGLRGSILGFRVQGSRLKISAKD